MKSVLKDLESTVITLQEAERDHLEAQQSAREQLDQAQAAFDAVKADVTARVLATSQAYTVAKQAAADARDLVHSLVTAALHD